MVFDGVRAGAMSYLLKGAHSNAVLGAIRNVHRGESQLGTTIAKKVMDEFRRLSVSERARIAEDEAAAKTEALQVDHLTPREMEVLGLLAEGKTNREIADALVLSEGTVKNHVSKIMGKLHANDRAQILVKAARRKLVKLR